MLCPNTRSLHLDFQSWTIRKKYFTSILSCFNHKEPTAKSFQCNLQLQTLWQNSGLGFWQLMFSEGVNFMERFGLKMDQ